MRRVALISLVVLAGCAASDKHFDLAVENDHFEASPENPENGYHRNTWLEEYNRVNDPELYAEWQKAQARSHGFKTVKDWKAHQWQEAYKLINHTTNAPTPPRQ